MSEIESRKPMRNREYERKKKERKLREQKIQKKRRKEELYWIKERR